MFCLPGGITQLKAGRNNPQLIIVCEKSLNITVGFKMSKLACKNISMPIFKNSLEWNLLAKSLVCFFDREKIKEYMLFLHKTTTTPKTKHQQKSANNISLSPHLRNLPEQNPSLENTYFQMHSIRRLISERLAVWLFLP